MALKRIGTEVGRPPVAVPRRLRVRQGAALQISPYLLIANLNLSLTLQSLTSKSILLVLSFGIPSKVYTLISNTKLCYTTKYLGIPGNGIQFAFPKQNDFLQYLCIPVIIMNFRCHTVYVSFITFWFLEPYGYLYTGNE